MVKPKLIFESKLMIWTPVDGTSLTKLRHLLLNRRMDGGRNQGDGGGGVEGGGMVLCNRLSSEQVPSYQQKYFKQTQR